MDLIKVQINVLANNGSKQVHKSKCYIHTYQAISNSVVLCTTQKKYLSNDSNNKIDGDGFPEVVQRNPINKQSSGRIDSIEKLKSAQRKQYNHKFKAIIFSITQI